MLITFCQVRFTVIRSGRVTCSLVRATGQIIRPIQPFLRPPFSLILDHGKGRTRHSYQLVRYWSLNGAEFVRRARRYARKTDLEVRFDPSRGKGSHGLLHVGQRRTVVKRGELKPGTFRAMLKQLGISEKNF